jgi:hypothetical protein
MTVPFEPHECRPDHTGRIDLALTEIVGSVLAIADDTDRLIALDHIIDGPFARKLQGERQKLEPWGQWMHSTYLDASTGHPEWRETNETRTVVPTWDGELRANLIVSDTGITNRKGQRLHVPMFDIDLPMRVVPSTHAGKGHLYINKPMPWENIVKLLDVLVEVGIVHKNYRAHSIERGSTTLRPAFVNKPDTGWSSDEEGQPFPDQALEDSLVPDYAKGR